MAEPTPKAKEIEDMLSGLTVVTRSHALAFKKCIINSTHSAEEFRDELSRKEYQISGLCQNCQDEVFD